MDAFEGNEIHKGSPCTIQKMKKKFCVVVAILNFKYAVN